MHRSPVGLLGLIPLLFPAQTLGMLPNKVKAKKSFTFRCKEGIYLIFVCLFGTAGAIAVVLSAGSGGSCKDCCSAQGVRESGVAQMVKGSEGQWQPAVTAFILRKSVWTEKFREEWNEDIGLITSSVISITNSVA